jgi:CRISPR-associated protein Csb2
MDLDEGLQRAITQVPAVALSRGRPEARLVRVWGGGSHDALERGRLFTSATPFVTERHYKKGRWRTKGGHPAWIVAELSRALSHHFGAEVPRIVRLRPLPWRALRGGRHVRWLEYRRNRTGDAPMPGYGFEIEFDRDVAGPFAVGYGAHFGLGLFTVMKE